MLDHQLDFETHLARKAEPWWPWRCVRKGHDRCRRMADRHYTRQTPGHPQWTRPGFNLVLYASDAHGEACFVWWRPKWESGLVGTERKDRLRVIECTMFRREGLAQMSSDLIIAATRALGTKQAESDLRYETMGPVEWLITGIGSNATARGRSRKSRPGECFRRAGWEEFEKRGGRADVWLRHPARRRP